MSILLHEPAIIHESGKQTINQNIVFSNTGQTTPGQKLMIVCDGDGDHPIAEEVAKQAATYLEIQFGKMAELTGSTIQSEASRLSEGLNSLLKQLRSGSGNSHFSLALSLVTIGKNGISFMYAGDCRAFHFSYTAKKFKKTWSTPELKKETAQASRLTGQPDSPGLSFQYIGIDSLHKSDLVVLASAGMFEHMNDSIFLKEVEEQSSSSASVISNVRTFSDFQTEANHSMVACQIAELDASLSTTASGGRSAGATGESQPNPSRDRKTGFRSWQLFAGAAVVIAVAAVALIYINSNNKYNAYMAEARKYANSNQFGGASMAFSRAAESTTNKDLRNAALLARDSVDYLYKIESLNAMADLGDLSEPTTTYLENATKAFDTRRYSEAALLFRKASLRKEQTGDEHSQIPSLKLAESLVYAADTLLNLNPPACELASQHIQESIRIFESQSTTPPDNLLMAMYDTSSCSFVRNPWMDKAMADYQKRNPQTKSRGLEVLAQATPATPKTPSAPVTTTKAPAVSTTPTPNPAAATNARVAKPAQPEPVSGSTQQQAITRSSNSLTASQQMASLEAGKVAYRAASISKDAADFKKSATLLQDAGAKLDGEGSYLLAYQYHMGLGVKKNEATAMQYAKYSYQKNWAPGQYLYASMLLDRKNAVDKKNAIVILKKAANQGFLQAINKLEELGVKWP